MSLSIAQLNTRMTLVLLHELRAQGVQEICICPSNRNASLVAGLAANSEIFRVYSHFEERSASFFALGRIKSTGRPVAVIATSGTAVGELLPATMEAHYAGLPLLVLSADRPRRYRGSGAPQAAEHVGIFGVYASPTIDLEEDFDWRFPSWDRCGPLHINVTYEEPMAESVIGKEPNPYDLKYFNKPLGASASALQPELGRADSDKKMRDLTTEKTGLGRPENLGLSSEFRAGQGSLRLNHTSSKSSSDGERKGQEVITKMCRPLILVSSLDPADRPAVAELLLRWKMPTYFEGVSGLREDPRFVDFRVQTSRQILERAEANDYSVDGVVRIGGIPTLRLWRDLDLTYTNVPVVTLSRLAFSGLGRPSHLIHGDLSAIGAELQKRSETRDFLTLAKNFFAADRQITARLAELFLAEPYAEPSLVAALSHQIPREARIYLGNSMPIRQWDLGATAENRGFDVWASRGLNGIDGQVSTFYGFAEAGKNNWGVIGDLTAMYDLPGPWILAQLPRLSTQLVVINNGGGKIFHQFYPNQAEFQNRHQVAFRFWAEMWGLAYERWSAIPEEVAPYGGHRVIELVPDDESSRRFWEKYQALRG